MAWRLFERVSRKELRGDSFTLPLRGDRIMELRQAFLPGVGGEASNR
jgi:hypothetical protein